MKYILYVFGFLLLTAVSMAFNGYVLTILWDWFVVPFFGIDSLSIPSAIGIAMIVRYLTHQREAHDDKEKVMDKLGEAFIYAIIMPLFVLFAGWVVALFM